MAKRLMLNKMAIFLDRDNTLLDDPNGFISDPEHVTLLPGVADALKKARELGYLTIVVSNQSGVARGKITEEQLREVHARMEALLREQGATLDDAYYCPYLDGPEAVVQKYRVDSKLRKPKPGMLVEAARLHQIDLSRSWMVGDRASDVEAGRRAGCRTVRLALDGVDPEEGSPPDLVAKDLQDAIEQISHTLRHPKGTSQRRDAQETLEQESEAHSGDVGTDAHDEATSAEPQRKPVPVRTSAVIEASRSAPPTSHEARMVRQLERISEQIDRAVRQHSQPDFSLMRLLGTAAQVLALVAAGWAIPAMLSATPDPAVPRLLLACFLQLIALTCIMTDRQHS